MRSIISRNVEKSSLNMPRRDQSNRIEYREARAKDFVRNRNSDNVKKELLFSMCRQLAILEQGNGMCLDGSEQVDDNLMGRMKAGEEKEEPIKYRTSGQYYTGVITCLSWLTIGTLLGYTSPAIPSMEKDKDIDIPSHYIPWIGSLLALGALTGSLTCYWVPRRIGYKLTIMTVCSPLFVLGYLLVATSMHTSSYVQILVGRFLSGFGTGIIGSTVPIFLGEIAQPKIRGRIGLLQQVMITVGILIINVVGAVIEWWVLAYCSISIPICLIVLIWRCPESPLWLVSKGRDNKAMQSLKFYRGSHIDHEAEFEALKTYVKNRQSEQKGTYRELLTSWTSYPLLVSMGLMFFQQAGGINAIIFNTVKIFMLAMDEKTISAHTATIIVIAIQVVFTLITGLSIEKFGRKTFLLISSGLQAGSMMGLSAYFWMEEVMKKNSLELVVVLIMLTYIAGFSLGFGPIPWLMMGELFPPQLKSKANGLTSSTNWFLAFTIVLTMEPLIKAITIQGIFLVFAVVNVLAFLFCLFLVKETKGKTLEEIEDAYKHSYDRRRAKDVEYKQMSP